MQRILVLRGGALGDFIVTLPALSMLRRRWPSARIELAGNARAAQLALNRGWIDAVHSQDEGRWSALFGSSPLPVEFAAWLASFDLVVNFWPDREGDLGRRLPLTPGQVFIAGNAKPAREPAAAHYCEALLALGLPLPDLFLPLTALAGSAHPAAQEQIALHPGSGSPTKNWPINRWISICKHLQESKKWKLMIVSGEAESEAPLAEFGSPARGLPLEELAGRLAGCRLFLGHDSGVSHLAAACGVPCLLLFGPTDPAVWAPPARGVRVIRKGSEMGGISVADVQDALARIFHELGKKIV